MGELAASFDASGCFDTAVNDACATLKLADCDAEFVGVGGHGIAKFVCALVEWGHWRIVRWTGR